MGASAFDDVGSHVALVEASTFSEANDAEVGFSELGGGGEREEEEEKEES